MTGTELQEAFGIELQQFDNRLMLEEVDIFHWLNLAQEEIIRESFEVFEESSTITATLRPLFSTTELDPIVQDEDDDLTLTGGFVKVEFAFPDALQYPIALQARILSLISDIDSVWRVCKIAQNDDVYRLLVDPFNRSTAKSPLASFGKELARVYTSSQFNTDRVRMDYIQKPSPVSRDNGTLLPEFVHRKLIRIGVDLYRQTLPNSVPHRPQQQ